jgi:hypothetical protein
MHRLGQPKITPIQEAKMNNTRTFNPTTWFVLAAGIILLLSLGFIAWMNFSGVNIYFGVLNLGQVNRSESFVRLSSEETAEGLAIYRLSERGLASPGANAEGLAIYFQSEHGLASPRENAHGLAIYHQSEWGHAPNVQSQDAGLEIYWQSERGSAAPFSKEEGMEIYLQSEHNIPLFDPDSKDVGMEIYYASERGR